MALGLLGTVVVLHRAALVIPKVATHANLHRAALRLLPLGVFAMLVFAFAGPVWLVRQGCAAQQGAGQPPSSGAGGQRESAVAILHDDSLWFYGMCIVAPQRQCSAQRDGQIRHLPLEFL